jgi:hypothetical protein
MCQYKNNELWNIQHREKLQTVEHWDTQDTVKLQLVEHWDT